MGQRQIYLQGGCPAPWGPTCPVCPHAEQTATAQQHCGEKAAWAAWGLGSLPLPFHPPQADRPSC